MLRVRVAAVLVLGTLSGLARANPPSLTPPHAAPQTQLARDPSSYRGLIVLADGTAVALMLWSLHRESELDTDAGLVGLSVATYGIAAPAIHLSRGRTKEALASLGLRVGLPLVAGLIGNELAGCDYDYDLTNGKCDDYDLTGMITGMVVGAIAASTVDTLVLAKADPTKSITTSAWAPTVRTTRGGVALGLTGRF